MVYRYLFGLCRLSSYIKVINSRLFQTEPQTNRGCHRLIVKSQSTRHFGRAQKQCPPCWEEVARNNAQFKVAPITATSALSSSKQKNGCSDGMISVTNNQIRNSQISLTMPTNKPVVIITVTRKGGDYSDVLPFKAARCDSISNLTYFGASNLSCSRFI